MTRRNWTRPEVEDALALYLRLPFGRFHSKTPEIIALAARIGRTPSAVAMKLSNLAALDASLPQKGMANASALDRQVWSRFLDAPEFVLSAYEMQTTQPRPPHDFAERAAHFTHRQGNAAPASVLPRIGQRFFREMILTSYTSRCALTGTEDPRLLTASHIVAWADDPKHRLDPTNGICLNALHDRAFDRHLITFDQDYRMLIADDVPPKARQQLERVTSRRLTLPTRFLPSQDRLETHRRAFHDRPRAQAPG